ncbi:hypothetical protein [Yinghuangia soli]|uniref:Uncharacterized protein n=1 Tax=Yinghuangia soli TaxID=2908204 RepID=A0AA41PX99_9ACTN|nr:hypothetical protein [Yinghuangia soli]MCF2527588.1 hypothetical protein [Yinghuangia soli]
MGFHSYVAAVADRSLPMHRRRGAMASVVHRYSPLGFHATWSYLHTLGDLRKDEAALEYALDRLLTSRRALLADTAAFAAKRRVEKAQHRRRPQPDDLRYIGGIRWAGPDGHAVMFREAGIRFAAHRATPFPDMPQSDRALFGYVVATVENSVSAYLERDGDLDSTDWHKLHSKSAHLEDATRLFGYPRYDASAFRYFLELQWLAALVLNDHQASYGGLAYRPPWEHRSPEG